MTNQPTLLSSCALAATAAEARYRIDAPRGAPRATRVVALDRGALDLVDRLPDEPAGAAHFLSFEATDPPGDTFDDVVLTARDGTTVQLGHELAEADFVMMVATSGEGAAAAPAIGTACTLRGIMTAALVVGTGSAANDAVAALRPHARVMLVSTDGSDAAALLSAVGS